MKNKSNNGKKQKDNNQSLALGNPFAAAEGSTSSSSLQSIILDHEMDELGRDNSNRVVGNGEKTSRFTESESGSPAFNGTFSPFGDHEAIQSNMASEVDLSSKQKHLYTSHLLTEEYEQPWRDDKRLGTARKGNWIIYIVIVLGFALSAFVNWSATKKVSQHQYCLVLDDSFSSLDSNVWNHEVQLNGFGTDSFDWTTTDTKNAYVDGDGLHIVPTLTTDTTSITADQIVNGYTLNLTATGGDNSCTANASDPTYNVECSILSNSTAKQIIPPVRSARLNTKGKKNIRYGRVEVTAKLPAGDWLWPAIWMMPEASTYGPWPLSGEIDIMESRGNEPGYPAGGRDVYTSTLHWGPSTHTDAYWRTTAGRLIRRTDYSKAFHTFGIEWSQDYMFTYIDNPLQQVFYIDFKKQKNMWTFGNFAGTVENNTVLENPWAKSANTNAPFDQSFFLILNVAVGGRNGWFPDNKGNKPWVDATDYAASDFYSALNQWHPTWGSGTTNGMTVKRVQMWQEGSCT